MGCKGFGWTWKKPKGCVLMFLDWIDKITPHTYCAVTIILQILTIIFAGITYEMELWKSKDLSGFENAAKSASYSRPDNAIWATLIGTIIAWGWPSKYNLNILISVLKSPKS